MPATRAVAIAASRFSRLWRPGSTSSSSHRPPLGDEGETRAEEAALADVRRAVLGVVLDSVRHAPAGEVLADAHDVLVVGVGDDGSRHREVLEQLAFGGGDLLDRAEELDVHRRDVRVDADRRPQESRDLGDLAGVVHPHLADDDFGVVGHVVEAERSADLIVEVAPRLVACAARWRSSVAIISFVVVFPAEPVMPMRRKSERSRIAAASFCSAIVVSATRTMALSVRDVLRHLRNDRTARNLQRLRKKLMPVEPFALDGEEDGVRLHFAGVDDDGGGDDVAALDDFAPDHRSQLRERQCGHESPLTTDNW